MNEDDNRLPRKRRRRRSAFDRDDSGPPVQDPRAAERAVLLGVLTIAVVLAWLILELVNGR